jgi:hypothetical protein
MAQLDMIIINLKGGLGNQMFQYAFGRSLTLRHHTRLALDITKSSIKGLKKDIDRPFLLDHFNIQADIATDEEVRKTRQPLYLYLSKMWRKLTHYNYFKFDPSFLSIKTGYIEGFWWQSEKYFSGIRDILLKEFTLKNGLEAEAEKIAEKIRLSENSVSLHVRRGDFVHDPSTLAHHGLMDIMYYKEAVRIISEKTNSPAFYIFSDDIEWAKEHLSFLSPSIFVSGNTLSSPEELTLMSLCRHHIIANSSFSWWGAWLGTASDKIVIAPKRWLVNPAIDVSDVYPPSWITI